MRGLAAMRVGAVPASWERRAGHKLQMGVSAIHSGLGEQLWCTGCRLQGVARGTHQGHAHTGAGPRTRP